MEKLKNSKSGGIECEFMKAMGFYKKPETW